MKSTTVVRACVLSGLMLAGAASAAELTVFTGPHFRGQDMTLHGAASNLERSGFNDRAESVIVRSGRWEVCSDSDYRGYCTVLEPGEYSLLNGPLFRRISSARDIAPVAYDDRRYYRYGANERYPVYDGRYDNRARVSAVELYTMPLFRGYPVRVDGFGSVDNPTPNGISSVVINEGTWEFCTGANYSGTCRVYEPGRYPRLGSFEGAYVGSVRRIG